MRVTIYSNIKLEEFDYQVSTLFQYFLLRRYGGDCRDSSRDWSAADWECILPRLLRLPQTVAGLSGSEFRCLVSALPRRYIQSLLRLLARSRSGRETTVVNIYTGRTRKKSPPRSNGAVCFRKQSSKPMSSRKLATHQNLQIHMKPFVARHTSLPFSFVLSWTDLPVFWSLHLSYLCSFWDIGHAQGCILPPPTA